MKSIAIISGTTSYRTGILKAREDIIRIKEHSWYLSGYQRRGLRLGDDGRCLHDDGLHLLEPDWLRAAGEHLHLPPSSAHCVLGLCKYVQYRYLVLIQTAPGRVK